MSSYYGLEHIIRECLDEKARVNTTARGKCPEAKVDIYDNAWQSLNTWIESKLAKQKGAGISGFGCFVWEIRERDGQTHCRPLFILSEAFIKSFKIKQARVHHPPQTTPIEEVNYSLLAIKFSKKLTKDMVFSGLRDILRKIGDFIFRGYEIEIKFSFGVLRSKERRVKFEFNQQRLQQILPENMESGIYAYDTSPLAYIEEYSEDGRMSARTDDYSATNYSAAPAADPPASVPTLSLTEKNLHGLGLPRLNSADYSFTSFQSTSEKRPEMSQTFNGSLDFSLSQPLQATTTAAVPTSAAASSTTTAAVAAPQTDNVSSGGTTGKMYKTFEEFERETNHKATLPADLSSLLDTLANKSFSLNKNEFRQRAKDRVAEQAYLRALDTLEDHARLDDNALHQSTSDFQAWKEGLARQREEYREQIKTMRSALDAQMEIRHAQEEWEKNEKRNTIMRFILPETAGMVTGSQLGASIGADGKVISSRVKIDKDIQQQIKDNISNTQKRKEESLTKERDYLKRLALEIELKTVQDRSEHLERQRQMLDSWEKEGHLRNVKKLQPFGRESVRDYVETNLAETTMSMSLNNPSTTIGGAINKSIGYDIRKGRL